MDEEVPEEDALETAHFLKRYSSYSYNDSDVGKTEKKKTYADATKILAAAIAACVILLFVLTVLLIIQQSTRTQTTKKVCLSADCVALSGSMLAKMDMTVGPCDDFYQYACGTSIIDPLVPEHVLTWGTISKMAQWTDAVIKQLIEKRDHTYKGVNSTAIKKGQSYFQACMNKTAVDRQSSKPLKMIIKSAGSWFVTDDADSGTFNSNTWNLEKALATVGRYGIPALFSMKVGQDAKDISIQRIKFGQIKLTLSYRSYKTSKGHRIFMDYFTAIAKLLGGSNEMTATVADEVWQFEKSLAAICESLLYRRNPKKTYNKKSMGEFKRNMTHIDISAYMEAAFGRKIPDTEIVLLTVPDYLSKMNEIVRTSTNMKLANYIIWQLVRTFVPFLSKPFTSAWFKFRSTVYGVREPVPRWRLCVRRLKTSLAFGVGALFLEKYFSADDKEQALEILSYIRHSFSDNINKAQWMDDETRARAVEKSKAISQMIGYPEFILSPAKLDRNYANILGTLWPQANVLEIREQVGAPKVQCAGPTGVWTHPSAHCSNSYLWANSSCSLTCAKCAALHSFGPQEGDSDYCATQDLIFRPSLHPGEDISVSLISSTTREAAVTNYEPDSTGIGNGLSPSVGGIIMSHWSAIVRLKLGSPRPIRCRPITVRLLQWVFGAQSICSTSGLTPSKSKRIKKMPAL
ncbi:Endothelin-converting enzyme 1 [Lamellibrachia satsuma]|nr:Endothelin-converting enzyme 1 [Lamellibrachia satsuma]